MTNTTQAKVRLEWGTQRYFTNGESGNLSHSSPAARRGQVKYRLSGITSPAPHGSLSPRRYLAALPSMVDRLESRRHRALRSWLQSCKSRTLCSGRHRRKPYRPCFAYRLTADSQSRRLQRSGLTTATRQKGQQRISCGLACATITAN
jgi:hypothetical protein